MSDLSSVDKFRGFLAAVNYFVAGASFVVMLLSAFEGRAWWALSYGAVMTFNLWVARL